MILIVGLGNPGEKYKRTRHNLGFMVVDELQKIHSFSDWQMNKKFKAEISKGIINNQEIILAKPQTYMNNSGKAVKILNTKYKIQNTNLWVVHDDLDLKLGRIKVVQNRGSAGHKGVQSIIDQIGTKDFFRFRIGIKESSKLKAQSSKPQLETENFVLKKFDKEEEKIIKEAIKKTCQVIKTAIKQRFEKSMLEFNCQT